MNIENKEKLSAEIQEFRAERKTLQLSTSDQHHKLNISYAPFAIVDDHFYILVSKMAKHYNNLSTQADLSLMLIEDESESKNIFARKRLTYRATAENIARDDTLWDIGLNALEARFGKFVRELESFADFHLFRLQLNDGLFVKGFGKAFHLSGNELMDINHLVDGHQNVQPKKSA